MSESSVSNSTIKQIANETRTRAIAFYGEAAFAKMCLVFEASLVPEGSCDEEGELGDIDEEVSYVMAVVKLLAHNPDPKTLQLSLMWLDGQGFGQVTLPQLEQWFKRYR